MTGNAGTITYEDHETDQGAAEAFGERMVDLLNCGALSLMLSVGHRTGLFDTMSDMLPAASDELDHDFQNDWYVCRP